MRKEKSLKINKLPIRNNFKISGMMLQRNGQIPNSTLLHQMVHSTSTTTRIRGSNKKRQISESSSSESECKLIKILH